MTELIPVRGIMMVNSNQNKSNQNKSNQKSKVIYFFVVNQ